MSLLLKNGQAFVNGRLVKKNILIKKNRITLITTNEVKADKVIECQSKTILPGGIDPHVHFRVPGMEKKEDWKTGSRAALAGGVTTVLDMPNTKPSTVSIELLEKKRGKAFQDSLCNFGFHFGATNDNLKEIKKVEKVPSVKLFLGSSTGSLLVTDEKKIEAIFRAVKEKDLIVTVHAEDEAMIQENLKKFESLSEKEKPKSPELIHNWIRCPECELSAIKKALAVQERAGNKIYFLHLTSGEAVNLAKQSAPFNVFTEATPHHLFLKEKEKEKLGVLGKVNPPLRRKKLRESLWQNLHQVDALGSDHAPHLLAEKRLNYFSAASGLPGVQERFKLMVDAALKGKISLAKAIKLCCEMPARIFKLKNKGRIMAGFDADLVIFDFNKTEKISSKNRYSKCGWTPYKDFELKGIVEKTLVNGNIVFDNGKFNSGVKGREVLFLE